MSGAIPPSSWPSTKRAVCLEYPDTPEWTALITGVLLQLSFGYYWDKNYANWEDARNVGSQILQSWFLQTRCDAGAIPIQEPQCDEYPNSSPLLDWQPASPFLQPGYIPPGYIAQPWGVVGEPPILTYQPGDVISGLFGLPVLTPALGQGLARVRVKFTGSGTVEVHLIKVALGGIALITWDDNPLTASFIDTSMDFLALPPESSDTDIQEITFDTDGPHHIDITMLPRFSAEAGFAGYGGGIRKVVLCGPDMLIVDAPPVSGIIDEFPGPDAPGGGSEVAICDVLRWNNGNLEVWCCNEWQAVPSIGTGIPGNPTQPPPSSPPSIGECSTYRISLNGKDQWLLPFTLSEGDTILLSDATGGWTDGSGNWYCPTGQNYALGICGSDAPASGGDPLSSGNHMQLIGLLGTGSDYFDIMAGVYTVPVGITDQQLTIQANDGSLSDNSGTVQLSLKVCHQAVEEWCYEYNTVVQSGPLSPFVNGGITYGFWSSGLGWEGNYLGPDEQLTLQVLFDLTNARHVEFDLTVTGTVGGTNHADIVLTGTGSPVYTSPIVGGAQTIGWDVTGLDADTFLNVYNIVGSLHGVVITRVKIAGIGAPPNGPSNC